MYVPFHVNSGTSSLIIGSVHVMQREKLMLTFGTCYLLREL